MRDSDLLITGTICILSYLARNDSIFPLLQQVILSFGFCCSGTGSSGTAGSDIRVSLLYTSFYERTRVRSDFLAVFVSFHNALIISLPFLKSPS